jgi:uncharacterized protein (TIGR03663 family)
VSSSSASKQKAEGAEGRRVVGYAQGRRAQEAQGRRAPGVPPSPALGSEIPERAWIVASAVILLAAAALRFYALELKPLHHDEGVNGFFLTNLLRQGVYHYDPSNYHGPTLYYLTLPSVALLGLTTFAVRAVTAAFGVATVWLVLALRRRVGAVGALAAAALVAVSPACVFYSRYFIHESLFVFFTLGIVVAALRFQETGAATYLLLASASAAMLFATKETAFISVGTLALAWLIAWMPTLLVRVYRLSVRVYLQLTKRKEPTAKSAKGGRPVNQDISGTSFFGRAGTITPDFIFRAVLLALGALSLFAFIWMLFYSSFFTYWKGVFWDSFEAFKVWKQTGMSEFHSKPFDTYVRWLWQEEAPILILAVPGAAVALFRWNKNRFAVFTAAWAFGLLLAYSLISYKTPWLVLSFVVPLAVAGGYAVQSLSRVGWGRLLILLISFAAGICLLKTHENDLNDIYLSVVSADLSLVKNFVNALLVLLGFGIFIAASCLCAVWASRGGAVEWRAALVVAAVALAVGTYQTVVLNFREYDNDSYPYVYSHTQRQALELVKEVERAAARAGTKEPGLVIASPEYWPLPWYFRDDPHAGYVGSVAAYYDPKSTLMVIARKSTNPQEDQYQKIRPVLAADYVEAGTYALRPGVTLVLFERRDIAGK